MTSSAAVDMLYDRARDLGFCSLGVADAELPEPASTRFATWIKAGRHAEMDYLARRLDDEISVEDLLPGCRRVVVLAVNYFFPLPEQLPPGFGRLARYAGTRDYHKVLRRPLKALVQFVETELGGQARSFVDTGPLSERSYAQAAGLGTIGRNSMLITPTCGSWVFLAVMLTDLPLPVSTPLQEDPCGRCRRCIEACPTGAVREDRTIDARRCLSYLTIEHRGPIPPAIRPCLNDRLFGCDCCQAVCPLNRSAKTTKMSDFKERRFPDNALALTEVLRMRTEKAFLDRYAGTPLMRAGLSGIQRNACLAAANSSCAELVPDLKELSLRAKDPVVAEAAAWAVSRMPTTHPPKNETTRSGTDAKPTKL